MQQEYFRRFEDHNPDSNPVPEVFQNQAIEARLRATHPGEIFNIRESDMDRYFGQGLTWRKVMEILTEIDLEVLTPVETGGFVKEKFSFGQDKDGNFNHSLQSVVDEYERSFFDGCFQEITEANIKVFMIVVLEREMLRFHFEKGGDNYAEYVNEIVDGIYEKFISSVKELAKDNKYMTNGWNHEIDLFLRLVADILALKGAQNVSLPREMIGAMFAEIFNHGDRVENVKKPIWGLPRK